MADYVRKTKDVYVLQGNYGYGWDDLTYEDSRREANEQMKCYQENQPASYRVIKRREKING